MEYKLDRPMPFDYLARVNQERLRLMILGDAIATEGIFPKDEPALSFDERVARIIETANTYYKFVKDTNGA